MKRPALLLLAVLLVSCSRGARTEAPGFDPDQIPEAFRHASGALMQPGATRAWRITADGGFDNGAWQVRVTPSASGVPAGPPTRIAAEGRWLPVLRWTRTSAGVRWDFLAVASALPAPRDSQLVAVVEVTARNQTRATVATRLDLALASRDASPGYAAWDTRDVTLRWGGGRSNREVCAWAEDAAGDSLAEIWNLAPGQSRVLKLVLPTYPIAERELARWAGRSTDAIANDERRRWQATLDRGARFELNDPEVENALRAALVVLLCCRERQAGAWVPIGGPFQYRDVWLRDGARAIAALSVAGQTEVARQLTEGLLRFEWPNGAFLSQRGQLDGTGQALWAMEQALLRPAPAPELGHDAEAALRACRWLDLQRRLGEPSRERFPALLPFADPRDAELTRAQLLGNDAWAIAGERAAARLLAAAGRPDDARGMESARDAYRAEFAAALARSGSPDLPPSWQGPGRDWGGYAAAWPCGAVGPGDARAAAFADRVWRAGGGAGLTFYGSPDSLHGYLGADLGVWAMLAGRRADAESVLAAELRWRTASGGGGELFSAAGDFGVNFPPHATAAAAMWMLVRNALVFDDDDTLRLTLGARERWWRGSKIANAPTRWGAMHLEFGSQGSEARWNWSPVPVWTALTLPAGTRLAAAPAEPLLGAAGDTRVLVPPGVAAATVAIARHVAP